MSENEIVTILVQNFTKLISSLENVAECLRKLETNEIEVIKALYEVRERMTEKIRDVASHMEVLEKTQPRLLVDVERLRTMLSAVAGRKDVVSVKIAAECDNCVVLKKQDKTMQFFKWATVVFAAISLTLLGLNILKYIQLPAIPLK